MDAIFELNQIHDLFQEFMDEPVWISMGTAVGGSHMEMKIGTEDGQIMKRYATNAYHVYDSFSYEDVIHAAASVLKDKLKLKKPTKEETEKAFLGVIDSYKNDLSPKRMQQLMNEKFTKQLVEE